MPFNAKGLLGLTAGLTLLCSTAMAQTETAQSSSSPRYASLKSDRVSLRNGPGTQHPVAWVFRRAGLPVEILEEAGGWRRLRDADGATGWVLQSMLSGRRTALVLPWEVKPDKATPTIELRADDRESAAVVASIEAGVIANVRSCDGRWCEVSVGDYRGHIDQRKLWGVAPGEVVK